MRKQFQHSWHDINFKEFIVIKSNIVADSFFYDSFYKQFFEKYSSYSDIPDDYVKDKMCVVRYLEEKIKSKESVLSIGCGIGLIEKLLIKNIKNKSKISAIEPSATAIKWISKEQDIKIYNGLFPDIFANKIKSFDFAYARAIEYIFNRQEYVNFLRSVIDFGIKEFVIISVCIERRSPIAISKEFVKNFLARFNLYDRGQLWGYTRTEDDHKKSFIAAGFKHIKIEYLNASTIVITGKI